MMSMVNNNNVIAGRIAPAIQKKERWITGMKSVMTMLILISAFCFLMSDPAHACTGPAGVEGEVIYSEDYNVPVYCDGTNWIAMRGGEELNLSGPGSGLVFHYKLDETTGTTAVDSSGNGNHGSLQEAGFDFDTYSVPGVVGNALEFVDINAGGTCGSGRINVEDLGYTNTSTFSYAGWFRRSTTEYGSFQRVFGNASGIGLMIEVDDRLRLGLGGATSLYSTTTIAVDQWYHYAITYNGTTNDYALYLNGVLEDSANDATASFGDMPNLISSNCDGFEGTQDDIRMYDRILSLAEIQALYDLSFDRDGTNVVPDGLIGHWRLDETTGTVAYDSAGSYHLNYASTIDLTLDSEVGIVNRAVNFNRVTGNRAEGPNLSDFRDLHTFSATAWVRLDETDQMGGIIGIGSPQPITVQDLFTFHTDFNGAELEFEPQGWPTSGEYRTTEELPLGEWVHVAVTYSYLDGPATLPRMYINGEEATVNQNVASSGSWATLTNDMPIIIGRRNYSSGDEWRGALDDVRLYNRRLTQAEIREIMNARDGIRYSQTSRTMQYFDGDKFVAMTTPFGEPVSEPTGTGYVPKAVRFDGNDDFIDSDGYAVPSSQQMTISFWFNREAAYSGNDWIFQGNSDADQRFAIYLTSAGDLWTSIEDDTGATVLNDLASFAPDTGAWHHYMMSFDAATGDVHVYVNDADDGCCSDGPFVGRTPDFTMNDGFAVGSTTSGTGRISAAIADLWIDYGTYLDLSVEANRRKFIDASGEPVNLGADGSTPTGSQPDFFFSGGANEFGVNKGTAVLDFTQTGALSEVKGPNADSLGLIAHYKLDETTGTTAVDETGNYNGTMQNGLNAAIDSIDGAIDSALYLNHVENQRINLGSPDGLDNLGPMTLSAWINPTDFPNHGFNNAGVIFGTATNAGASGYWFHVTPTGSIGFFIFTNASGSDWPQYRAANSLLQAGDWQHVAMTWDGNIPAVNVKLYVNGVETPTYVFANDGSGTFNDSARNKGIGTIPDHPVNYSFNGGIDDFRIYDRVLTDTEVAQLYNMGTPVGSSTALPMGCPNIGDVCDDGTIYAGLTPDDGTTRMFVAAEDAPSRLEWNDNNTTGFQETFQTSLTTGLANTLEIIQLDADTGVGGFQPHRAGQYCHDLTAHGAQDWYLPARDELELFDAIITPANISTDADGYWSSTESSDTSARGRQFNTVGNLTRIKHADLFVRCVRKGPAPRCADPYGLEGEMIYNSTNNVVQFCDGARWRAIGK